MSALGRTRTGLGRAARAWRALTGEQHLAAYASVGLFLSMFLPWYSKSDFARTGTGGLASATSHLNAFEAFSFVEAAVLLVAAGVLYLLFARGEQRAFHLPGGDGATISVAGGWATALIFYRFFDKRTGNAGQQVTFGVTWGIFIALLAALLLIYAGSRVRAAARPEPPLRLDVEEVRVRSRYPPMPAVAPAAAGRRRLVTREDAEQLSFDDTGVTEPFSSERR